MADKEIERLFIVIQTMDSDIWDPERCDYLDSIDQNKVRLYDRDAGLYESEIAKGTVLTEREMKSAILAMDDPQFVFDYIKEYILYDRDKKYSSEYIIEKITRIKNAAEIRNLKVIPVQCHKKINENILAIERELHLISHDEYIEKWTKQIKRENK